VKENLLWKGPNSISNFHHHKIYEGAADLHYVTGRSFAFNGLLSVRISMTSIRFYAENKQFRYGTFPSPLINKTKMLNLMEPPISEPMPKGAQQAASRPPSPPKELEISKTFSYINL
jgi:hypothetical protein